MLSFLWGVSMITLNDLAEKSEEFAQLEKEFYQRESLRLAYYAVFHALLNKAKQLGIVLKNNHGGVHNQAIFAFEQLDDDSALQIAALMKRMKRMRVKADYMLSDTIFPNEVSLQLSDMRQCLTLFNDF